MQDDKSSNPQELEKLKKMQKLCQKRALEVNKRAQKESKNNMNNNTTPAFQDDVILQPEFKTSVFIFLYFYLYFSVRIQGCKCILNKC